MNDSERRKLLERRRRAKQSSPWTLASRGDKGRAVAIANRRLARMRDEDEQS